MLYTTVFSSRALRKASRAISGFAERSHEAVWKWLRRFASLSKAFLLRQGQGRRGGRDRRQGARRAGLVVDGHGS